jgi:cytochrome b561
MNLRNTPAAWGAVSKAMHWSVAVLVLFLIAYGAWMTHVPERGARLDHYLLHSVIGYYLALLLGLRIIWRMFDPAPPQPAASRSWERWSAHAGHFALYALMIAVSVSGWVLHSAFPRRMEAELVGGIKVPLLFAQPDRAISQAAEHIHKILAYALLLLVIIHVAAALRHHFIKRNDVLRRMTVGA